MTDEQFEAFIIKIHSKIVDKFPNEYEQAQNQAYEGIISDAFEFAGKDEYEFMEKMNWF